MKKFFTLFSIIFIAITIRSQNSTAQYSLVFEDFEELTFPPAGWVTNNWYHQGFSGYGTGNYCISMDLYYNCYGTNPLEAPPFAAPTKLADSLVFDYSYAPYDYNNYHDLIILYSSDNGSSYNYLYTLSGYPGGELTTSDPTTNYFYPQSYEWKTFRYELPEGTTNIKFETNPYNIKFGCSNNLFIDNVKIGHEVPYTDIAVKNVFSKGRYARTFLSNDTISAYIKNEGNQEVNNLKVYLDIGGANIRKDSVVISNLPAGGFEVVKFNPYTPVLNGNGIVKVRILHNDEVAGNDSALYNLNVNSNYLSYTDTAGYMGGLGVYGRLYFVNKYYVTNANSRISEIRARLQNFDGNLIKDQVITGVLLNSAGTIIAKSVPYKLQTSDTGKYISLKLSNPLPFYPAVTNTYFYAGFDVSDAIRNEYFFSVSGQTENPMRINSYFASSDRSKEVGENVIGLYDVGSYNYGSRYDFQVKFDNMPATDAGISNQGSLFDQYYSATNIPQTGKVYNNALSGTANATVIRTITPGGYTSSQPVSIPANSSVNVTFANWTFMSGTTYSVRDSIILSGDVDLTNNVMKGTTTPRIAKDLLIFYQRGDALDSLERALLADGRYANNYDVADLNYTGSFRPWKIVFANPNYLSIFQNNTRDSLKSFLDNSTAGNKKSLIVFSPKLAQYYSTSATVGDTIFMKQYLRADHSYYDWFSYYYDSENKFKGNGFFSGITQDSLSLNSDLQYFYEYPDLIRTVNGSSVAFLPLTADPGDVYGNAVCYAGTNYNTFLMTNRICALRSTESSPSSSLGPVRVYTKIIDWIQSVNTGAKVLDLTAKIEGFYDPNSNTMNTDTMRVYLRSSVNPYPKIDSAKAFLNTAGQASFMFNNASNGTGYYIQLKHRNGLETWSSTPQSFSSNSMTYDFTDNSNKAYGDNMSLSGDEWVIFTGDVNQNGFVELTEVLSVDNEASAFASGYVNSDVNGNNFTDLTDVLLAYNNSRNFVEKSTPISGPMVYPGISFDILNSNPANHSYQPAAENKIDHEIYDRHKNESLRKNGNTGFSIIEKEKGVILFRENKAGYR
ncbi:MAG: hypothetical protein IPL53_03845 [Ignavibacteria bacterium]|nr:hypothetical protein [Ignavibacteria bacterium]